MNAENYQAIVMKQLDNSDEIEICARMMANLEPWITLGRDYEASVQTLAIPSKEVYLLFFIPLSNKTA